MKGSIQTWCIRLAAAVAVLSLVACQTTPLDQTRASRRAAFTKFDGEYAPASLGVCKVANESGDATPPTAEVRELLHENLLERGFSPLSDDYVDRITEGGRLAADEVHVDGSGMLSVRIYRWDEERAESHGMLYAEMFMTLFSSDGLLLGSVYQKRSEDLNPKEFAALTPKQRRNKLVERVVSRLFTEFPQPPPL